MGEALLVKFSQGINQETLDRIAFESIPVTAGVCTIYGTVYSSLGEPVSNCYVCCNDGGTWYNYHTNENGKVIFSTNSGQLNITAWNNSVTGGWRIIDQIPASSGTIDAPVGTKKQVNITLGNLSNRTITFTSNDSNFKILGVKEIKKLHMVGGGGGGINSFYNNSTSKYNSYGGWEYTYTRFSGNGGGGGAYNTATNIKLDNSMVYNVTIGSGGAVNSTGGTTSAFGYSAVGGSSSAPGGSGSFRGGEGGKVYINTSINLYTSFTPGSDKPSTWNSSYRKSDFSTLILGNGCGKLSNYHNEFKYGGGGSAGAYMYRAWQYMDSSYTYIQEWTTVFNAANSRFGNSGGVGGYWTGTNSTAQGSYDLSDPLTAHAPSGYGGGGAGGWNGTATAGYKGVVVIEI